MNTVEIETILEWKANRYMVKNIIIESDGSTTNTKIIMVKEIPDIGFEGIAEEIGLYHFISLMEASKNPHL